MPCRIYFDERANRWRCVHRRGSVIEAPRFHREDEAHAYARDNGLVPGPFVNRPPCEARRRREAERTV